MMNNYWGERQAELLLNKHIAKAETELSAQYIRCFNKTKKQLSALYNEVLAAAEDGTLLISDLYKYNRYYELLNDLNKNLTTLGAAEIDIGNELLTQMYKNNVLLLAEQGFSNTVNDLSVKNAINAVWCNDGKRWSDRIWTNKAALEESIKNGLVDCFARGDSKDEMVKELMGRFNVGFNQADRIARTELSYVQNQSAKDKYEEAGVTEYEILAEGDDVICEYCADMDGKRFPLAAAVVGDNYPPFHPNCRCTVLAVIE